MKEVDEIIQDKIYKFVVEYNIYPRFIKVPLWLYQIMKNEMEKTELFKTNYVEKLETYRNLKLCPTVEIKDLKEIEVF